MQNTFESFLEDFEDNDWNEIRENIDKSVSNFC